ncbi:MAG: glutamate--cysteine ligase [Proteobacteria bacterium]|nr:MAG: glutamate--cysteine ligase [Pseudomonadota bacterium]
MYTRLEERLHKLSNQQLGSCLRESRNGLEKESLRVNHAGHMAQTNHPRVLGSALTHPWITTDYAEALLELITPPQAHARDALDFLLDIETFVYQQLDKELLWTTSMPCILGSEADIRIAEYGHSNAGQMKHVYRRGLAWRYGKTMQVIAGIHFNYSIAEDFWSVWFAEEGETNETLRAFRDRYYMGLTRNLLRYGWLVIYLFGTSPAICKSFLGGRKASDSMRLFNKYTLYEPYGTSLRMGNIGYTNTKENETGIRVCYDTVQSYTESLRTAINTPCSKYAEIGVKVAGEYRQLNANILQIENEYYSTVRPKQPLEGFEKPVNALRDRGIRYIELRSIDINAYYPSGLTQQQLAFLEVFMHFCLLQESPNIAQTERTDINHNQYLVAHKGRLPGLKLKDLHRSVSLKDWANELLQGMQGVAELLDTIHDTTIYRAAVQQQQRLVDHPEYTPSARMLEEMQTQNESFFSFARRKSEEHRAFFLKRHLSVEKQQSFEAMARESLEQQIAIEAADHLDFDSFLKKYFEGSL